jgi:hypothetical protein
MPHTAPPPPSPLGLAEIAELLGVGEATPTRWKYLRHRTGFPLPDGKVSKNVPYWWPATIETWARATGRWPGDDLAAARSAAHAEREAAAARAEELRAEAALARERILVLQAQAAAAEEAAAAAEALAAEPVAV